MAEAEAENKEDGGGSKLAEAKILLKLTLEHGGKPQKEIEAKAQLAGISERTLRRASKEIHVKKQQIPPGKGSWVWSL